MSYLIQLTDYNSDISLGPNSGDVISQSLVFGKSFYLNKTYVRIGSRTIDEVFDVKIRIELRRVYGEDKLLNLSDDPVLSSSWVNDESITENEYNTFEFERILLGSGTYFFSFVSNLRVRFPISFSLQKGGSFRGKFIKKEYGSGTYRTDRSLVLKVDGSWNNAPYPITVHELNSYVTTTIQDGS